MCGEMRARCCAARGRVKDSIFALVASVKGGGKINFLGSDLPVFVAIDSCDSEPPPAEDGVGGV